MRRQRGAVLIVMLVAVTLIVLFAACSIQMMGQGEPRRRVMARAQTESFMTALAAYKRDTGTYPTTDQGLIALRVQPENVRQWAGPYLPKDIPMDAWGRPYLYKFPGEHGDQPDILSLGADAEPGGDGNNADINSWSNQ